MPAFEYTTQELSGAGGVKAILVKLNGSIDPSTFEDFNAMFETLLAGDMHNIAIDFQDLKYINSTGMGLMVQVADSFLERGGKVVLTHIPSKVMLVMEMLGLQEFFEIVADENAAIATFAGEKPEEASVQMHIKGAKSKPKAAKPKTAEQVAAAPATPAEPRQVKCGHCAAKLTVSADGGYRCPRCRALLEVDASGVKATHPEKSESTAEMVLPARAEFVDGLCLFLTRAADCCGLSPERLQSLNLAVQKCSQYIFDKALKAAPDERLHVLVVAENGALTVRIYAAGQALKLEGRDLAQTEGLDSVAGELDLFEYSAPQGGNLFVLVKNSS